MAITKIQGIIKEITPVQHYGQNNEGRKQSIILFVPGYVNQFGEKTGSDEEWQIDLFNKAIDHHNLNSNCIDKKAEIECYLSSRSFDRKDGAGKWYSISANLKTIKLMGPAQNSHQPTTAIEAQQQDGSIF